MQTSKKIIALVAAVVVLAAAGGGIWLHHRKTAETESAAAVYVSTVAELNAANPDLTTLCYSGVTEAQETKEIKADTSKTIAETYVKEGDTVKKERRCSCMMLPRCNWIWSRDKLKWNS